MSKLSSIYHLIKPHAAVFSGHSAIVIPAAGDSYTLYTWYWNGVFVFGRGELYCRNFPSLADALADAKADGYTHEQHWSVSLIAADAAAFVANSYAAPDRPEYNSLRRNCWHMVCQALAAAGIRLPNRSPVPNLNFHHNKRLAEAWSRL